MLKSEAGTPPSRVGMREYTRWETAAANTPYAAMIVLGAVTIAWGFHLAPWAVAGALTYAAYGVGGAVWIMVFVCPYCAYYGTRGCPCGYGTIAAKLVAKGDRECFAQKFKRHIPVIVLLWIVPVVVGVLALMQSFNGGLLGVVGAFALNSYIVLPLLAKRHSCGDCPQRDGCPWMPAKKN
ncbi:MAG TPA: hypothetical protein VI136_10550 [Verrucomicrobiae bacterium]